MDYLWIRKLLEAQLVATIPDPPAAGGVRKQYPNLAFDINDRAPYIRATFHPAPERPTTLGPTPNVEQTGFFSCDCFVPGGDSEDQADILANRVLTGFAYSLPLTRMGETVEIARRVRGPGAATGEWYYIPVSIYWIVA